MSYPILRDGKHACRKQKTCDQCLRLIRIGERYRKQVYVDGGLQVYRAHEDCDAAARELGDLAELNYNYDDFPILANDICPEDHAWLAERFPNVTSRLLGGGKCARG